ncbi:MAG: hypothetical protein ACK4ND_06040 [Cytophagaceae bacterium]
MIDLKNIRVLLLCLILPVFSQAQIVEEVSGSFSETSSWKNSALKVNPLLIMVGDMPIYYERKLGERISVELGAGITTQNFLYEIGRAFNEPIGNDYEMTLREHSFGYSLSGSLRLYYEEALKGLYIGPEFRMRHYASEIRQCGSQTIIRREHRNMQDITFQFGYIAYLGGNLFFDFYIGIGPRFIDEIRGHCVREYEQNDPFGNYSSYTHKLIMEPNKVSRLTFNSGLKVGFSF